MTIQEFVDERKRADMRFWVKISDLADGILMLAYTNGNKTDQHLKNLMEAEMKISQIEL